VSSTSVTQESHHKTCVLYQIQLSAINVVWLWCVNSTWM